jgi:hypothetical protein
MYWPDTNQGLRSMSHATMMVDVAIVELWLAVDEDVALEVRVGMLLDVMRYAWFEWRIISRQGPGWEYTDGQGGMRW